MSRAVILAGGLGTRLKPYTISMPKPLVPINDMPVLEIIIMQLKNYGFSHITLAVNHLSNLITDFFGDGSKWNLKIDYIHESKPLSTMGPLSLLDDLPDKFLVMNGDVISDLNYRDFLEYHSLGDSIFSISSFIRKEKIDYGVLDVADNRLLNFKEKPEYEFKVSMGIYACSKEVLSYIPQNMFYGFDNLMNAFISADVKVNVITHEGYWLDIGRPSDYLKAIDDYEGIIKDFLL